MVVLLCTASPAYSQIYHPEVTFKDSLTQLLFQYGREVYYRGVDPQEASYVFQRIILLDCDHHGAQEFLTKIHDRYPNVSIKIRNCSQVAKNKEVAVLPQAENNASDTDFQPINEAKYIPGSHSPALIREDSGLKEAKGYNMDTLIGSEPIDTHVAPTTLSQDEPTVTTPDTQDFSLNPLESKPMMNSLDKDCDTLRSANLKLQNEVIELNTQIRLKDAMIVQLQEQLAIYKDRDSVSFASIAEDQQNLIRIQQGNIDYLQKELDDVKNQVLKGNIHDDPAYLDLRNDLASAQLELQEKETLLEAKNKEAFLLQKQLGENQEQLRLVKKILVEKNEIIKSLQEEIDSLNSEEKQ
ncbi:MAG: hypothetical protein JNN05_06815 [Candidatus Omnitrophica bacterium]|nr:hypothetical protein [Candidatus Omnitrophota bacterium]